jgi:protein-L-isoaspartate(D-aspartate) O-methyltransferase
MKRERDEDTWTRERREMTELLQRYGIRDPLILAAMGKVRRHLFIPEPYREHGDAYGDHPVPIGIEQTISQPYIVAYMIGKLAPLPGERVLEIGAGSGYQAALLAELGASVFGVELVPGLARHAREILEHEGYADRVRILTGDGYKGWPDEAPFDAMVGACAPVDEPTALFDQLKEGGRAIFPIGEAGVQRLVIIRKAEGRLTRQDDLPVRFVPMVKP